jgi:hypothetical protein
MEKIITWTMNWIERSYYSLSPGQLIITWWYYEISDNIWLYMPNWDEFATLNQQNWEIKALPRFQWKIDISVEFTTQTPMIIIKDSSNQKILFKIALSSETLIWVNSNTSDIVDLTWWNYWNFEWWKYIKNTNAEIYVNKNWFIYVPSNYSSSLKAEYKFANSYVIYQIKDELNNEIATITVKVKPLISQ